MIWSTTSETSSAKDTINNKSNNKIPPNLRKFKSKNSKVVRKMKAILTLKVISICSIRLSNRGTKRTWVVKMKKSKTQAVIPATSMNPLNLSIPTSSDAIISTIWNYLTWKNTISLRSNNNNRPILCRKLLWTKNSCRIKSISDCKGGNNRK